MRLLMYYDGREHTRKAVQILKTRAKIMKSKVHLVSCIHSWGEPSLRILTDMRNDLHVVRDVLDKENIPCQTHVCIKWRNPGDYILDVAYRYNVDEIIIGTNKESKIAKYRHGWFITHVLDWAQCPVLLV